jgi:hypothetical protein
MELSSSTRHLAKASFVAPDKPFRLVQRSDQSADGADHCENAGDVALIESMDGNAGADELCCDLRLEIGECEDKIRLERKDLRNIGRDEGRNTRLLAPDLGWPHGITGHADDAVLLTEKVKRFDRLLRQADDPGRRKLAQ